MQRLIFSSLLTLASIIAGTIASTTPQWIKYKYHNMVTLAHVYFGLYTERKCYIVYGCYTKDYSFDTYVHTNFLLAFAQVLFTVYLFVQLCYLIQLWLNAMMHGHNCTKFWFMIPITNIGYIIVIGILLFLAEATIPPNDHPNKHVSFDGIGYGMVLWITSFLMSALAGFVDIADIAMKRSRHSRHSRSVVNDEFSNLIN